MINMVKRESKDMLKGRIQMQVVDLEEEVVGLMISLEEVVVDNTLNSISVEVVVVVKEDKGSLKRKKKKRRSFLMIILIFL